ncbi:MAG: hypothetical protein WDZ75_02165, partial [Candidatus Paceibacterota bacterium]
VVGIGAGGAYMSDVLFVSSLKDNILSRAVFGMLSIASKVVWVGLALLVLSGTLLFFLSPEAYASSTKFLAKMTIVGIIILNGIVFHFKHLPLVKSTENRPLFSNKEFKKGAPLLVASGAISMVSWTFAIIFGVLRSIPYSYLTIMSVYLLIVLFAVGTALFLEKKLFKSVRASS